MFVLSLRSFVNSSINTKPFTTLLSTLDLLLKKPNLFLSPSIFSCLDKHWVLAGGLSVSCCVTLARTSGGCCPGRGCWPLVHTTAPSCTDCCRHSDGRGEWRKYLILSMKMLALFVLQNKYLNIYYLCYEIFRRRHFRSEHVYYLSTMTGSYLIDISIFIF